MATTEDVEIPKPLTSGATDNPNAPQSGAMAPPPLPTGAARIGAAPAAPVTHAAPPLPTGAIRVGQEQPSTWQVLTQPTEKTDKEYLGYKGPAGVAGATVHGLNRVAEETKNAVGGLWNQAKDIVQNPDRPLVIPDKEGKYKGQPTIVDQLNPLKGLGQVAQVPGAIRDINASPDPTGYYAQAAEDTAAQGAGQALTAIGTEKAGEEIVKPISKKLIAKAQAARPEAVAHTALETRAVESEKALATAQAEMDKYSASLKEGIQPPADVVKKYEKAAANAREDRYHADTAKKAAYPAATAKPTPKPTPQPEVPTEQIEAMPRPGASKPAAPQMPEFPVENAPKGTEAAPDWKNRPPITQPDQPEATAPQHPEFPMVRPGEAPAAPKTEAKIAPKAEAPAPKPAGMRDMNKLKVNEKGDVIDTSVPQDRLHSLLQQSLEPEAPKANEPAAPKAKEEPISKAEEKPVLPKEEPTGYAAKNEEVVKAGEEGRTPAKSAAEYHPAVEQKVSELSDEKLRTLAKAHGLNPDEYDFKARDEGRHRVERDQLAKDITAQMGEDEKINLGRAAEQTEKQGLFQGADKSAQGRAARAEKMFPRLRGPVDEYGNPKVAGGAPDTVGTKEAADKDTEHFANAKKELGDKASISDVAKRAQELKDRQTQADAHNENGGSTFHPTKGNLDGKPFFSVGGEPEFRDPKLKMTTDGKSLTAAQLDEFSKRPEVKAALDKHKDASIGSWFEQETGKTITELVKTPADRDEAIAMGTKNGQKAIWDLKNREEIKTGGTGKGPAKEGFPDKIDRPTTKGKAMPTGDALIKKYGVSNGDPKDTTFILDDGRAVANSGTDHDIMLGGKATDKNPPRERFVAEGNIRVRPHMGTSGRETSFSIPESGVNAAQLAAIQKMSPQLRTGAVMIEVGKPGGKYEAIPYGEATDERIEQAIQNVVGKTNPPKSLGSASAGTAFGKEAPLTPEQLQERLPDLAQQHLTQEEKDSITTTATGKPRNAGTSKFIQNMTNIPTVKEYTDIALQGEGARKWYSRSTAAFDAMHDAAPDYFKDGDKQKFMGVLAGDSPQQAVASNLRETLGFWKEWHDAGRPELSIDKWKQFSDAADAAWKEDGSPRVRGMAKGASMHWDYAPTGDEWKAENLLLKNLTLPEVKVPNIIKAIKGEPMWPDLQKNAAFKAPSFAENLRKWIDGKSTGTKNVTNDSWMGLFGGIDKSALSRPENYHPLSVATRAAADELGWEPEEAQAAIWSFTQALTEKGVEDPELVRHYSEDFKDLMANDLETRDLLKGLGVNLDELDSKLNTIEDKPQVSGRSTPTTAHSVGQLKSRIEDARGKGAIPEPKSVQGNLFRENPAFEHKVNPGAGHYKDEATDFNPEELDKLNKPGEKKKPGFKKM